MAVRLRLMRMGKKKQPFYRIVAADSRSPRDGRFIEVVGTYDPRRDPSVVTVDNERAVHWLHHGALPTERVEQLLKISGAWDQFKGTSVGAPTPPAPTPRKEHQGAASKAKPQAQAPPRDVGATPEVASITGESA